MASKAVAQRSQAEVEIPDLAQTPATTITADDIAIPRVYQGQSSSTQVGEGRVKLGDIYSALNADDGDPQLLWSAGSDDPGVLFHVLHLRKGKSFSAGNNDPLQRYDYDDPNAPAEAWVTYNYTVVLPEVDLELPYKMLFVKTSKPAALKVNGVLARNAATGPMWANAFRYTTAKRKKEGSGPYSVAQVAIVTADPKHVEASRELYSIIAPGLNRSTASTNRDNPEI